MPKRAKERPKSQPKVKPKVAPKSGQSRFKSLKSRLADLNPEFEVAIDLGIESPKANMFLLTDGHELVKFDQSKIWPCLVSTTCSTES